MMNKRNNGITLVALVITIIVLLIMAGVSIALVVGDNGIISRSAQAKNDSVISQEIEQIELAYTSAKTKNLGGDVSASDLQNELDLSVGVNKTTTRNGNNTLNVFYQETKHNYNVNKGRVTRLADGEVANTGLSDAEKLKQFYLANNYNDDIGPYVEDTPYEVDGKEVWFICGDEYGNGYVLYNGSIFQVEIDLDNEPYPVTDVQFIKTSNIDLTTFGEYTDTIGTLEIKVLVTPSTPESLVHGDYYGPTTAGNELYYLKEDLFELDYNRPFIGGYETNDNYGSHYYDATGEPAQVSNNNL